jgi:hypothetical protein
MITIPTFALQDGTGPAGAMAAEMVAILVEVRAASMAWVLRTLVFCVHTVMFSCNILFVDLLLFLCAGVWGMCGENLSYFGYISS